MCPYARVRKLTEEEYQELKRWERSRTMGVSKVRRAKIVLLSHRGLLVQEIAEKLELPDGVTRRNLLTERVPLTHLVGHRFRVGEVLLYGVEIATLRQHLVEVSGIPKLLKALLHRAGLHAQVVTGGVIRTGDVIKSVDA